MIITSQNRETILQTFREYPAGLSISELSRKCGINRNKCSQICSDYHKTNILGLIQRSSYKIYFLKHQSVLNQIIDAISGPAIVVNESFSVIGTNEAYDTVFKTNQDENLGRSAEDLLNLICPDLIPEIQKQLQDKMSGKTATFLDESGLPRCKTLTLSLTGNLAGIIILPTKAEVIDPVDNRIKTIETQFTSAVPHLITEKTWPQALGKIAKLLQKSITEALIFTLLIDESLKTCTIHTIATPADIQKGNLPDTTKAPLTGIEILQYKTTDPVTYFTGTEESLHNTPLPRPIKNLCQDLNISSITLFGISSEGRLTSVIGIGTEESGVSSTYLRLLRAISGYLTLLCTVCQNTSELQNIQTEYQKNYREIYALLTEKTEETAAQTTEAEYLRTILGAVLHTMNISLIAVNKQGTLFTANKTASTNYSITDQDISDHKSIHEVLSPELASALVSLIPEKTEIPLAQRTHTRYIEKNQSGEIHWHLFSQNTNHSTVTCLFIGEPHPAPLLRYLQTLKT